MGFHMDHYAQGHASTDFWRWTEATAPYDVEYELGYEPYVLMARQYTPW